MSSPCFSWRCSTVPRNFFRVKLPGTTELGWQLPKKLISQHQSHLNPITVLRAVKVLQRLAHDCTWGGGGGSYKLAASYSVHLFAFAAAEFKSELDGVVDVLLGILSTKSTPDVLAEVALALWNLTAADSTLPGLVLPC